jgi:hypothetical protein
MIRHWYDRARQGVHAARVVAEIVVDAVKIEWELRSGVSHDR